MQVSLGTFVTLVTKPIRPTEYAQNLGIEFVQNVNIYC